MSVILSTSQTGNGDSNVASTVSPENATGTPQNIEGPGPAGAVVITTVVGATPTVTVNIQGSADGVSWLNIPYALIATPTTFVTSAIVITTAVTNIYLLQAPALAGAGRYPYLKLVYSANTNVTITAGFYA